MDRSASSLLSWLLLPVAALLVVSALSLPGRPYTGLVQRGSQVITVLPGSPAERASAKPGDHLLGPGPRGSEHEAARLLAGASQGRPVTLLALRDHARRPLWLVPAALPDGDRRMIAAILLVASGFVMLGGWVWSERRDPLTRTFFLLCLGFAWLLTPLPSGAPPLVSIVYEVVLSAVTVYLPALFVQFFALFPDRAARGTLRVMVRTTYFLATVLFAASLALQTLAARGRGAEALSEALETAAALWFTGGLVTALILFANSFRAAGTSDARRRLRVAFAGTLLGALPITAFILIRNVAPQTALPGERAAVLATLLVPASFAWATVVHAVFDFRVALRIGSVVLVLAVLGAALYVGGEWLAATWWPHLGAGIAGAALALLTLGACIAGPLNPWMRSLGSRVIPEPAQVQLPAWAAVDPSPNGAGLEPILGEACLAVQRFLRVDRCVVIAFGEPEGRILHHALAPAEPIELPELAPRQLSRPGVRSLDEVDLEPQAQAALGRLGIRWLIPIGEAPVRAVALLGRRLTGSWLGRHEVVELERYAAHLGITLENLALRREVDSRGHLDRELREAGAIQAHFLPRRAPVFPTLDCAAAALSSEPVGGDYYDFIEGPGRDFTVVVGDAAGKGVPAALVLAGVQARFRNEARRGLRPAQLLQHLNQELVGLDQPEKFVGLLCARVAVRNGRLWFANAGLTPPILWRRTGHCEELTESGVLLGVRSEATYADTLVELAAGDVVVIYTDGLTEARRGEELFGPEGVQRVLEQHGKRRAADILDALLGAVREFADGPLDDVTVVVLRQLTEPVQARQPASQNAIKWTRALADPVG